MANTYPTILTRGLQAALASTAIEDGKLRYTTDTGRLYMDIADEEAGTSSRIKVSDIEDSYTEAQIKAIIAPLPKLYLSSDTHRIFVNSNLVWYDISDLNLTLDDGTENVDKKVMFAALDGSSPRYATNLNYNNKTETLKTTNITASNSIEVGGMKITTTISDDIKTVNFAFA